MRYRRFDGQSSVVADAESVAPAGADVPAVQERIAEYAPAVTANPSAEPDVSLPRPSAPARESRTARDAVPPAAAEPALRFRLEWWRLDDLLLVSATRSDTGQGERSRLVHNIFRALARDPDRCEIDALQWPLAGVPTGREAAADMLAGFLSGQLEQNLAMTLVLAGELVTELLLGTEIAFAELVGARVRLLDDSLQACVVPELDRMLEHPLAKRDAWRALKTLRVDAESASER